MQTAIHFLEIFSDMESQGMREYSVDSGDGIRVMKRFSDPDSRSGAALAFGPRIKRYQQQIDQVIFDFQQAFFSSTDIFGV